MPIFTKQKIGLVNIVKKPPNLPIKNYYGNLSINFNFGDHPSASISYQGVPEKDLSKFESVYMPDKRHQSKKIIILGAAFRVAPNGGYSYERENILYQNKQIDIYTVSISLESYYKVLCEKKIPWKSLVSPQTNSVSLGAIAAAAKVPLSGGGSILVPKEELSGETVALNDVLDEYAKMQGKYIIYSGNSIKIVPIDRGRKFSFSWSEQISDGSNSLGIPSYYNGSELTWNKEASQQISAPIVQAQWEKIPDEIITETEDDSQNVFEPPKGTVILRDLSSNYDKSGPKKVSRTTTKINGQPSEEIIKVFGFRYLYKDGEVDESGRWFITEPHKFWGLCEETTTIYNYKEIPAPNFTIRTPQNTDQLIHRLVTHPDYTKFVETQPGGGVVRFLSATASYLYEIETTGWRWVRLVDEEQAPEDSYTMLESDPYWKLINFQKVDKVDKTLYYLKSMRGDYAVDALPFSVEWENWDNLSPEMKSRLSAQTDIGVEGAWTADTKAKIGIVTPDLDYVEPLLAWTESRQASSIAIAPHPDSTIDDPIQPFVVGEESYFQSIWTKKDEQYATQKTVDFSAQDPGFVSSAEQVKYKDVVGKPSEATSMKQKWQRKDSSEAPLPKANSTINNKYLLYSDEIPEWASEGEGSINVSLAKTLKEALLYAETDLKLNSLNSSQKTRTISWYLPNIREGDFCSFQGDRFQGRWGKYRVLSVSLSLDFDGVSDSYKLKPVCICQGTQLTLGRWDNRTIRVVVQPQLNIEPVQDQGGEQNLSVGTNGIIELGGVLPLATLNRRNIDY